MANAERVKGAAEAYRYGSLLGCDLEEVGKGQPLRGLAGVELFTEEVRAAFRSLRQQGGRHE